MRSAGRYVIYGEIASGGMATVHFGRLVGPAGFSRTVAVKRLHPHLAKDPEFVAMFLDEARLAARIRHPNVVPTLDVVASDRELFLVMDYVQGESLARLLRASLAQNERIAPEIAATIMGDVLLGLHAAHSATDARGNRLNVVHRDISPQNILVGVDGVARVVDFGVAKALGRAQVTREGQLKGKLGYMAPEQLAGRVSHQSDIYAASVVLWELLTGQRLHAEDEPLQLVAAVASGVVSPPGSLVSGVPPGLDALVLRGLSSDPEARFDTAEEMATALRASVKGASAPEVGAWVASLVGEALTMRDDLIAEIESSSDASSSAISAPGAAGGRSPDQATASMQFDASPATLESIRLLGAEAPRQRRDGRRSSDAARPSWMRRAIGAAAAVAVVGTAAGIVAKQRSPRAEAEAPRVATAAAAEPAPAVPVEASSEQASAAPAALPSSAPAVAPSPTAPSDAHPAADKPAAMRRPATTAAPRATKPNCNPWYTEVVVGTHIRRVPKPECI